LKKVVEDTDGNVIGVELDNGTCLDVDMVIIGAGIRPNSTLLSRNDTGVKLDHNDFILTDMFLQTHNKDIFAAGDVTSFMLWTNGK